MEWIQQQPHKVDMKSSGESCLLLNNAFESVRQTCEVAHERKGAKDQSKMEQWVTRARANSSTDSQVNTFEQRYREFAVLFNKRKRK